MRYFSTRTPASEQLPLTFSQSVLTGLAEDGGLYLPQQYPQITPEELQQWAGLSYAELAYQLFSKFCDDIPKADIQALTQRAYTASRFAHARDAKTATHITPLTALGVEEGAALSLLELSNGPTLAFKDLAMQLLGEVFEYVLDKTGATLNILGATSGDTGSAAEYAMRGKRGVQVFMLSPYGKMSPFQAAQMYSLQDKNIFNIALDGVFDDAQDIVKAVSSDQAFKDKYTIGTVNSINWLRVLAQVVYYFKAYFSAIPIASNPALSTTPLRDWPKVTFSVPSGNFGNVCAGYIARKMGLPIQKLVVATNENDVLDEFFKTGIYRVRKQTHSTSSPSMDISKASNIERLIFDIVDRDAVRLRSLFEKVQTEGGFDLSGEADFSRLQAAGLVSNCSHHAERIAAIRDVYTRYQRIIDPHTADGLVAARKYLEPGIPMIVLETAQPIKFNEVIEEALGQAAPRPSAFDQLETLPQRLERLPVDVQAVKDYIAKHVQV